jgi:hypothetical protein
MEQSSKFYKDDEKCRIWWVLSDHIGEWLFSFDKKKIYNMYQDYPDNMTAEEVKIFDEDFPFWAEYFKDRN